MTADTIAAVSTAVGEAAISVVRISGPEAMPLADRVFRSARGRLSQLPPREVHLVTVVGANGNQVDEGLVVRFVSPASYTGEDVVEYHGHGGLLVTRRVLERVLSEGARAAQPGEFTQRAFLNGKMDLTQAEGVMDLIHAQSDLALRAANEQLGGVVGREATTLRELLVPTLAHVEAFIDFPEEGISPDTGKAMVERIDEVADRARRLLATAEQGRILRQGARTVIFGPPNAGKSSLLNRLLGFERAIVSQTSGTTRDTIEEGLQVHGIPLCLVDTAGVRDFADEIESEGIRRTHEELGRADLVIEVADGSKPREEPLSSQSQGPSTLLVRNKSDLEIDASWSGVEAIPVSCVTGDGVDSLRDAIRDLVLSRDWVAADHPIAINARHKACFERVVQHLEAAKGCLLRGDSPEFVALDLRDALESLGEVVGQVDVEQVLDVIFSSFCIGK
jgi:tRNA modification GTPase